MAMLVLARPPFQKFPDQQSSGDGYIFDYENVKEKERMGGCTAGV